MISLIVRHIFNPENLEKKSIRCQFNIDKINKFRLFIQLAKKWLG